jgi:hypothetical protein
MRAATEFDHETWKVHARLAEQHVRVIAEWVHTRLEQEVVIPRGGIVTAPPLAETSAQRTGEEVTTYMYYKVPGMK